MTLPSCGRTGSVAHLKQSSKVSVCIELMFCYEEYNLHTVGWFFYRSNTKIRIIVYHLLSVANNLSFPSTYSSLLGCLWNPCKVDISSFIGKKDHCLIIFEVHVQKSAHLFLLRTLRFTMCLYSVAAQDICTSMKKNWNFSAISFFSGHECTVSETFDILKTLIVKHSKDTEIYNVYNSLSYVLE